MAGTQILTRDFTAAEAALQQALALLDDLGDHGGQGDALNGLGTVHWLTGDYPAAVAGHQQALELFRSLGHQRGPSPSPRRGQAPYGA